MIFLEFVSLNFPTIGAKHYFVGKSEADILAATEDGRKYCSIEFQSKRVVSMEYVRSLDLGLLEAGIAAVKAGTGCFKLRTPE